ncbi:MAG TPA: helix-turn-helix transcriptional regulator [Catenuloplanes sp.]|jgi:DNA-binding CsgD family transcriptional regulator
MFESFGISATAEVVYRALLRDPHADPDQLLGSAEDATAVQEAIDELGRHGLLEPGGNGSRRLGVVPPERAIDILITEAETALNRRREALAAARGGIGDLVAEFVEGRRRVIGELVEQIHGSDAVRSRLYQLSQQCTREVCSINPGPAPPSAALEASRRMERQSLSRGIVSRSVFAEVAAADPDMFGHLAGAVAAGDEIRVHPDPPLRMLLIDGEVGVIPIDQDDHVRGAYVLHGAALLSPLSALFEIVWRAAERFDPAQEELADSEDARIRQVVALLADGYKDEAIARRLTVSVRTVRRLIALAVERLQAESRFQAGVFAVRRGWLGES